MVDSKTQVMNNKKKPAKKAVPKKAAKKPLLPKAKTKQVAKPVKKQVKKAEPKKITKKEVARKLLTSEPTKKAKPTGRIGVDPFKKSSFPPAKPAKVAAKAPVIDTQLMQEITVGFNRMSDRDKRVLVAQDSLKYLKAGIIEPTVGEYVHLTKTNDESVQKDLLTGILRCKACQKGILLIAAVGRKNHVNPSSLKHLSDGKFIYSKLEFFTQDQLDLMETAFEKEITNVSSSYLNFEANRRDGVVVIKPTTIANKAIKFGTFYDNPTKRMSAILENIVDNNGEFRP